MEPGTYVEQLRQGAAPSASLADLARKEGLVCEAAAILALVGAPPEPGDLEDTQLRSWRVLLTERGPLRLCWLVCSEEEGLRARWLAEALGALGHACDILDLGTPGDPSPGSRVAAALAERNASGPEVAQVLILYRGDTILALPELRPHLAVVYSNPPSERDWFVARYLTRNPHLTPITLPRTRQPRFSIVIPTRGNPECLEHALRTVLAQRCDDYEVVVGDNSDPGDDRTEALVRKLDADVIRHVRPDRVLDLTDNFEFAHAHARGDYRLGLGSDDGLLFHGLESLAAVLDREGGDVEAMRFDFLYYGWPSALPRRFQNFFRIPPTVTKFPGGPRTTWVDSREMLARFARQEVPFYDIPNGYGYSILSRPLVERIIRRAGRLFPGNSQDVNTGVYVLACTDRFLRLDQPITAFASSGMSIGSRNTYAGDQGQRVRHALDTPRMGHLRGLTPPAFSKTDIEGRDPFSDALTVEQPYGWPALETCNFYTDFSVGLPVLLDAINRKLLPRETRNLIDWKAYFQLCSTFLYEDDPQLEAKRQEIVALARFQQLPELEAWLREGVLGDATFRGHPAPVAQERFQYGLLPNGVLYLDGADFGITNVYEAAELFQRICHL